MTVRYTTIPSTLGRLLVAATDKGVCLVGMADTDERLEDALPAGAVRDDAGLAGWAAEVVAVVAGDREVAAVPVDQAGTPFQQAVWDALCAIPRGSTRTYGDIALGRPGASQAVGNACGANQAAVVIPCHRAVRFDGGLGGYRWGLARKQALLAQEGALLL